MSRTKVIDLDLGTTASGQAYLIQVNSHDIVLQYLVLVKRVCIIFYYALCAPHKTDLCPFFIQLMTAHER